MQWKNEAQIYELYGKFCIDFEQVCRSMEACIRSILDKQGLTNEQIQDILLSGYTAEPLRKLLQNLVGEVLVKNSHDAKVCSKIFNIVQELTSERNNIIHSKWFILGFAKDDGVKEMLALGEKLHANMKGAATKKPKLDRGTVEENIAKCGEASILLALLMRCLIGLRKLNECFQIKNGQLTWNKDALKPIELNV
jgi:hypothetical protein